MPSNRENWRIARAQEKRRLRSSVRTRMVKATKLIGNADSEMAQQAAVTITSSLDRAATKGAIHKNKAARLKSRFMKKLNQSLQATNGG